MTAGRQRQARAPLVALLAIIDLVAIAYALAALADVLQ